MLHILIEHHSVVWCLIEKTGDNTFRSLIITGLWSLCHADNTITDIYQGLHFQLEKKRLHLFPKHMIGFLLKEVPLLFAQLWFMFLSFPPFFFLFLDIIKSTFQSLVFFCILLQSSVRLESHGREWICMVDTKNQTCAWPVWRVSDRPFSRICWILGCSFWLVQ